jgi:HEAT repeat protein
MRSLLALLLAGLLSPAARADDGLHARVVELLSAYEDPPSAAEWRALGEGAGAELFTVAQDTTLSPTRRAGAVYALGFFPSEARRTWLATLAGSADGDAMLRRKACYALANGWAEGALPELSAALASPDVQLRAAAARAIGRIAAPAARTALERRLGTETDAMVRGAITASLGARQEAP